MITIYLLVVFGFSEPDFIGQEQGENYEVVAGYLSGRPNRGTQFMLGLNLGGHTAGNYFFAKAILCCLPLCSCQ